ncbi:MAG: hypothetical protein EZS28_019872 [Streblomastix strix]|uniref:Uncharacterized protein n=1 Tax=Streblomastix strix TaxID=222440 RepID=A0A5J4VPS7_9EUKA|nr:MAG: hypothetical protein EZS28_019872 [Streblomastix strix]
MQLCLREIQLQGDQQVQAELINVGYGRVLFISVSAAGGTEEQEDDEISWGLFRISNFFYQLNNGRNNNNYQPSFPPQPALSKSYFEQIEEEGGNEEIESQLINNGKDQFCNKIKVKANQIKRMKMNYYIYRQNTEPD